MPARTRMLDPTRTHTDAHRRRRMHTDVSARPREADAGAHRRTRTGRDTPCARDDCARDGADPRSHHTAARAHACACESHSDEKTEHAPSSCVRPRAQDAYMRARSHAPAP
eukprot:6204889-Pleurochrysis_carterae.AAC.2